MLELKFTKKEKRIHRFLINLRDISQFQLKSNHRSFSINSLPVRREIQNFNAREFHLFVAGHRRPNDYIHPLRSINHRSILHARRSSDAEKQVPSPQIRDTVARVGYERLDRTDAARLPLRRFFSRPVGFSSTDSPRSPPRPSFSARLDDPRPPNRNFRL